MTFAKTCLHCVTLFLLLITTDGRHDDHLSLSTREGQSHSFSEQMQRIPWHLYSDALDSNASETAQHYSTLLIRTLTPFLKAPPSTAPNESCHPPPLQFPEDLACERLRLPRKVGMLLQFAFDVDILEILLHELDAVVDKFFIVESNRPYGSRHKLTPMLWEHLQFDERFVQFLPKVVHFVINDTIIPTTSSSWINLQARSCWEKFLVWNNATKYFKGDDLLAFGNVDTVPYRNNIYHLKNCELIDDPVDIGMWNPFGFISPGMRADVAGQHNAVPVPSDDPTIWTFASALNYSSVDGRYPTRMRGSSRGFMLAGFHMSSQGYPPFPMMTELAANDLDEVKLVEAGKLYALSKFSEGDLILDGTREHLSSHSSDASFQRGHANKATTAVSWPWFFECNPSRYLSLRHDLNFVDERLESPVRV